MYFSIERTLILLTTLYESGNFAFRTMAERKSATSESIKMFARARNVLPRIKAARRWFQWAPPGVAPFPEFVRRECFAPNCAIVISGKARGRRGARWAGARWAGGALGGGRAGRGARWAGGALGGARRETLVHVHQQRAPCRR